MDDLNIYARSERKLKTQLNYFEVISKETGMEFGLDKCAVEMLVRREYKEGNGITTDMGNELPEIDRKRGYAFSGVTQQIEQVMKK